LPAALATPEPKQPLFSGLNERNVSDAWLDAQKEEQ